jgi:arylsulfatase A-like enzyme
MPVTHSSCIFHHSLFIQRLKRHHNGTKIVFQEATAPAYEGAVVAVDDAVGKLLAALRKHGIEQETLILITGDNGANIDEGGTSEPYRGGKGKYTQQEGWVHTPTVITWPQRIPAGETYSGLMGTIDFYATVTAAAGPQSACSL